MILWSPEGQNPGVRRAVLPLKALGKILSHLFLGSGVCWQFLLFLAVASSLSSLFPITREILYKHIYKIKKNKELKKHLKLFWRKRLTILRVIYIGVFSKSNETKLKFKGLFNASYLLKCLIILWQTLWILVWANYSSDLKIFNVLFISMTNFYIFGLVRKHVNASMLIHFV